MLDIHFKNKLVLLRNLNRLDRVRDKRKEHIFKKLFEVEIITPSFIPWFSPGYTCSPKQVYHRFDENCLSILLILRQGLLSA